MGYLIRIVLVVVGDFVGAIGVNNFLVPGHILAGGVTGVSQLIFHFTHIGLGTLYFLLNIPLFILGYRTLGTRFIVLTGVGIAGFSVFTDVLHIPYSPPHDPLLVALYGGVLMGISSGIVIRAGGSTGGTDIVSLVMNRRTGQSVGGVSFAMNVIVVLLSITVFGANAGLYTLVSMFAASRVVNSLMTIQQRRTALIVTTKPEEISKEIFDRLGRGSTLLHGTGTYSHSDIGVLMCALTVLEVDELNTVAERIDPQVFISILHTTQVVGKFKHVSL